LFPHGREDDGRIREALGALCEQALQGALDSWADPPRARLTLAILLDQWLLAPPLQRGESPGRGRIPRSPRGCHTVRDP
jgi:hypothetical protein